MTMTTSRARALLGIDRDADERDIKRAYARLLKATRPDEDPEGFQHLNEAYRVSLAELPQDKTVVPLVRSAPPPERDPPPLPARGTAVDDSAVARTPAFDRVAFSRTAMTQAAMVTPQDLRRWLVEHPDLVLLQNKHAAVPALVEALEVERPLQSTHLDVLLVFFGIDEVTHAYPSLNRRIDALRSRSRKAHPTWGDLQFRESAPRRREHNMADFNPLFLVGIAGLIGLLRMCQAGAT